MTRESLKTGGSQKRHQPYAAIGVRTHAAPPGWTPSARQSQAVPRTALVLHPIPGIRAWIGAEMVPRLGDVFDPKPRLVLPQAEALRIHTVVADGASEADRTRVVQWSRSHGLGRPLTRDGFLRQKLRLLCYTQRAAFVTVDDPAITVGTFAVRTGKAAKDPARGAPSMVLFTVPGEPTRKKPRCANGEIEDDLGPRIVARKIDRLRSFVAFKPTGARRDVKDRKERPRGDGWRGVFVSLRGMGSAQGADGHGSLEDLCESFSVRPPAPAVDPFDRALEELRGACRLYAELLVRHLRMSPDVPPGAEMSSGTYAKAMLRKLGLAAPLRRFRSLRASAHGFWMGAYFGGEVRVFQRTKRSLVRFLDFSGAYAIAAILIGTWDILAARDLRVEQVSRAEAVAELARLGEVFGSFRKGNGPRPSREDWRSAARLLVFVQPRG